MDEQTKRELTAALESFLRNRLSEETDLGAGDGDDMLNAVVDSVTGAVIELVERVDNEHRQTNKWAAAEALQFLGKGLGVES